MIQDAPAEGSAANACYVAVLDAKVELSCQPYRDPDSEWAVWITAGTTSLGHVFWDGRFDGGLCWVFVGDRYETTRFESRESAVAAMLDTLGLQCPPGFFDRAEEVKNGRPAFDVAVDKIDKEVI